MAHQHEIAPPEPTPCPQCDGERIVAEGVNNVRLTKAGTKLPGITGGFTEVWAVVCTACGLTMLYAKDPRQVRP